MKKIIKKLAKRVLPASLIHKISHKEKEIPINDFDLAEAWKFKRYFFWTAFRALDFNGIDGDYAEFGSFGAKTFRLAFDQIRQRSTPRHMWSFDSFQGLPDSSVPEDRHPQWISGKMAFNLAAFKEVCTTHGIAPEAYTIVKGFYEDTLSQIPDDAPPQNIALAYIDCDMYSSTKAVLRYLTPRLKHGMILTFDDYFCWSSDQLSGERKAFFEFIDSNPQWHFLRYRDIGWAGTSFIVEKASLHSKLPISNL